MGRYSVENKTNAGLDWVGNPYWVPAKILVGTEAIKTYTEDCVWFGKVNKAHMEQLVGDRIPHLVDQFKREYTGNQTFGSVLVRRAAHCMPRSQYAYGNDELARFKHPIFAPTYDIVTKTAKKLTVFNLQELQQTSIMLKTKEAAILGGLYIRWNEDDPRTIYVGTSDDIKKRSHTGTGLYLWDVFATADYKYAELVEKKVHKYLRSIGQPYLTHGKGRFRVDSGNAREHVLAFIRQYYREPFVFHHCGYFQSEE